MKRCLILTGGKLSLAFAGSFLKKSKYEKVIAVDGGLEAAKELGIIPDVIVGDFDTVRPEILCLLPENGTYHMGSASAGKR